jgi:hypothetical protein
MTPVAASTSRSFVGVVALACLGGAACTVWLPYGGEPEQGTLACRDGVDNDLDGATDCADSECWGVPGQPGTSIGGCEEGETATQLCGDGFDNDLDGRADLFDFGCNALSWEDRTIACASVQGSHVSSLMDVRDDWAGSGNFEPDQTGRFEEALRIPDGAEVRLATALTGARAGTRLEIAIRVPEDAALTMALELDDPLDAQLGSLRATVEGGAAPRLILGAERGRASTVSDPAPLAVDGDWIELTLELGAAKLVASDTPDASLVEVETGFPLGRAPSIRIGISAAGGDVTIGDLAVSRERADPCLAPVPDPSLDSGRVWSLTANEDTYCLVYETEGGRQQVLASERPAFTASSGAPPLPRPAVVGTFAVAGLDVRDPAFTWDDGAERFVGTGVVYDANVPTNEVVVFASSGCTAAWDLLGAPTLLDGGSIEFGGRGGGVLGHLRLPEGQHQLHLACLTEDGEDGVTVLRSRGGDPLSLRTEVPCERFGGGETTRAPRYTVGLADGQSRRQAALVASRGAVFVDRTGNLVAVLRPSRVDGTFDRAVIEQAVVWLPEPVPGRVWTGLLAYTARACATCPLRALRHRERSFYGIVNAGSTGA